MSSQQQRNPPRKVLNYKIVRRPQPARATARSTPAPPMRSVQLPVARPTVTRNSAAPTISMSGEGCRIRHREVIWSPTRTAAFASTSFIINPGRSMFPWLKSIAPSFEYYHVNSMTFKYTPNVSFTETGMMAMIVDYDPLDDDAGYTMDQLLNMSGSVYSPVYKEFTLTYNNPRILQRYTTLVENSEYDRMSDCGQLLIARQGNTATDAALLGTVSVTYDLVFYRPQPSPIVVDCTIGDVTASPSLRADQPTSSYIPVSGTLQTLLKNTETVRDALKAAGYIYDMATGRITVPPGLAVELFGEVLSDLATGDSQLLTFANAESSPVNCTVTPRADQPPLRSLYSAANNKQAARATVTPTDANKPMSFIPTTQTLGFNSAALIGTSLSMVKKEL